ncbi:MAG: hypothetical protein ACOC53_05350 [Candidatus Saliniplasma sp.]
MDFRLERDHTVGSIFEADQHGNIVFSVGPRGLGKTHDDVCYNYDLTQRWNINHVFTNEMFKGELEKTPLNTGRSFRDLWTTIADIRMDDPFAKIKVGIDEFQETVHRFRSTSAASVIIDKWVRQLRKQSITCNFMTQNTYSSIPINILYQGDYIIVKNNDLLDEFNSTLSFRQLAELNDLYKDPDRFPEEWEYWLNPKQLEALEDDPRFGVRFWRPPQDPKNKKEGNKWDYFGRGKALSFVVDISIDLFKQIDPDTEETYYKDLKQFKEYKITLSDVQGVRQCTTCPWTEVNQPGPTFNTNAYASFNIFPLEGKSPVKWVPEFMRQIGGVDQEDLPQVVLDFFEKGGEEDSRYSLEDFSKSQLARFLGELPNSESMSHWARFYGITPQAAHQSDLNDEQRYWLAKHYLKLSCEEALDKLGLSQSDLNQSRGGVPAYT